MDLKEIRAKSLRMASKFAMPINGDLPFLDDLTTTRTKMKIFERIMCLHVAAACAYGFNRKSAADWILQENLTTELAASELDFIYKGEGDPAKFKVQIEGMWALSWALGLVSEMDFSKGCDNSFALLLPDLKVSQSLSSLRSKLERRPDREIMEACDLAYCLHWGVRELQIIGEKLPKKIVPYVVIERRRALDWLTNSLDWDDVTLDT